MSKRYGRNQKRRARETIKALQDQLTNAHKAGRAMTLGKQLAERKAADAKAEALKEFIENDLELAMAVRAICDKAVEHLTAALREPATEILKAVRNNPRNKLPPQGIIDMTATIDDRYQEIIISGTVPELRYNYVVRWNR